MVDTGDQCLRVKPWKPGRFYDFSAPLFWTLDASPRSRTSPASLSRRPSILVPCSQARFSILHFVNESRNLLTFRQARLSGVCPYAMCPWPRWMVIFCWCCWPTSHLCVLCGGEKWPFHPFCMARVNFSLVFTCSFIRCRGNNIFTQS